jgi:hypothetical protein
LCEEKRKIIREENGDEKETFLALQKEQLRRRGCLPARFIVADLA